MSFSSGRSTTRARAACLAVGLSLLAPALPACGGAEQKPAQPPAGPAGAAGAGGCGRATQADDRPFVIAWSAGDLATFEARAARETVFVRRVGCGLEMLQGCADPAIVGRFGAYRPPQRTSGALQAFDLRTPEEVEAALPLGAATLSKELRAGSALRVEVLVAGVTTSTRDAIDASELAGVSGCAGATHFVWAYELGAFRIASGGAGPVARGGDLATCASSDPSACRVPLRLTLRAVTSGTRSR